MLNPAAILKDRALGLGFDLAGIAPASALKDLAFCREWLAKGYGGEMRYLSNPRREDPRRVLPSVKSVVCVGLIYNAPYPYSTEVADPAGGEGDSPADGAPDMPARSRAWISRYAWGSDYHTAMRGKLEEMRAALEGLAPGVETRAYVDTGPVVERAFARLAGIGWMGKNTCLISERKGSWFFLGVILTSMELTPDVAAPDRCGSCTRCLQACPTGALVEPYVMDASRCISYFNIELKGAIPEEFREAMGKNVFGCDICQDVCPWNRPLSMADGPLPGGAASGAPASGADSQRRAATSERHEFQPMRVAANRPGAKPAATAKSIPDPAYAESFSLFHPEIADLASLTEVQFRQYFGRSPIRRAKYRGWLRNLCVAMGNSGDTEFIPWLEAKAHDTDAVVREHAGWALNRLRRSGAQGPTR